MKKPKTKFKVRVTTPVLTNDVLTDSYTLNYHNPKFEDEPWICTTEIESLFGLKRAPKRIRLTGTTVKPKRLDGAIRVLLRRLDIRGGTFVKYQVVPRFAEWFLYPRIGEFALRLNIKTKPTPVWIKLKKL